MTPLWDVRGRWRFQCCSHDSGIRDPHSDFLRLAPNLPAETILTKIRWLNISGKFSMGLGIPPLRIKILLGSNPPKSRILVPRLAENLLLWAWTRWPRCRAGRRRQRSGAPGAGSAGARCGSGAQHDYVYIYIYIYIYTYHAIYIYIYTSVNSYLSLSIYIYIHMCVYIYIYLYIYISLSIYIMSYGHFLCYDHSDHSFFPGLWPRSYSLGFIFVKAGDPRNTAPGKSEKGES